MKLGNENRRLLIFFFYDPQGIVDRYIPYMLNDMKRNVSKILFVSNGEIAPESRPVVESFADEILERKNEGLDAWAYKEAQEKIGWDALAEYDELVLMNYTIMGPVYPFREMFEKMNGEDLDFWGMTCCHKVDFDPSDLIDLGYIPEHLQSHFLVIRKKMLASADYRAYWEKLPKITTYNESVAYHETYFTRHFAGLGYRWQAYVKTDDLQKDRPSPIIFQPKKLIEERHCPVFKRRCFIHNYDDFFSQTAGESTYELMTYLRDHTDYDTDMIWENILRCYEMSDIKNVMQLNYVLSSALTTGKKRSSRKIALVFHAYFADLAENTRRYVNCMPADADIYITTDTSEKKRLFEQTFAGHKFHKLQVIQIENRGRDVSSLLVGAKDFIMDYDLVCFAHDKKVVQFKPATVGAGFAYQCLENVLGTDAYVENVIDLFEKNPRLGLLTPPPPFHGDYFSLSGDFWTQNFDTTRALHSRLGLRVPISRDHSPIAPLGTMFWFRPVGMKKLFDVDWNYSDFPQEPNGTDGTILHAIERIYGFVEQDAGFYSAWGMVDYSASMILTNYAYICNQLNDVMRKNKICGRLIDIRNILNDALHTTNHIYELEDVLKKEMPKLENPERGTMRLYYSATGELNETDSLAVSVPLDQEVFSHTYYLPRTDSPAVTFRFDPEEQGNVAVSDFRVEMYGKNGSILSVSLPEVATNGIRVGDGILFPVKDPSIGWSASAEADVSMVQVRFRINRSPDISLYRAAFSPSAAPKKRFRLLRKLRGAVRRIFRRNR